MNGMTTLEVRTFICLHCNKETVVHPELPQDFTPTVCRRCWYEIEEPRQKEQLKLLSKAMDDLSASVAAWLAESAVQVLSRQGV